MGKSFSEMISGEIDAMENTRPLHVEFYCSSCRHVKPFAQYELVARDYPEDHLFSGLYGLICSTCYQRMLQMISTDQKRYSYPMIHYENFDDEPLPQGFLPLFYDGAKIVYDTPIISCHTLRDALRLLCIGLGESGQNLQNDIQKLVSKECITNHLLTLFERCNPKQDQMIYPFAYYPEETWEKSVLFLELITQIIAQTTEFRRQHLLNNREISS
jgi:hypothetical protein